MKLHELKLLLTQHADASPRFILPTGETIPAHYHITEVGHVVKRFIDCGGKIHETTDTCLLQTYVANDFDHRLTAQRFGTILGLGEKLMPGGDLEVEVEYDCCVVAQYPIGSARRNGEHLDLHLRAKRTACLAKERTATEPCCVKGSERAAACC